MNRKSETYAITRKQLIAALEGLDAVIEDTEVLIESLVYPTSPGPLTPGEKAQLIDERQRLRNFRTRRKELTQLMRNAKRTIA